MKTYFLVYYSVLAMSGATAVAALARWRSLNPALRCIAVYVLFAVVNEGAAAYGACRYHYNWIVYTIGMPVYTAPLAAYFGYASGWARARRLYRVFPIVNVLAGIICIAMMDDRWGWSTLFETVAGVAFSAAALFMLGQLLAQPGRASASPHFWICIGVLAFWGSMVPIWVVMEHIHHREPTAPGLPWVNAVVLTSNVIMYGTLGAVLALRGRWRRSAFSPAPSTLPHG